MNEMGKRNVEFRYGCNDEGRWIPEDTKNPSISTLRYICMTKKVEKGVLYTVVIVMIIGGKLLLRKYSP